MAMCNLLLCTLFVAAAQAERPEASLLQISSSVSRVTVGADGVASNVTAGAKGLASNAPGGKLSVKGTPLASCSTPGTALTGFTRSGSCVELGDDDKGSHHICIKMESDFCTTTGQPDWCSQKMECMGQDGLCDIGNWCICQWAFASYIEQKGDCDAVVDLECDATNMAALRAYEAKAGSKPDIKAALECLKQKCSLP